jgi:hypothetical protein
MTSNVAATSEMPPALRALRQPIETFEPRETAEESFQRSMLGLADLLADLWKHDEGDSLESNVVATALYAFPALAAPGPTPEELVELAAGGRLMDAETADLLETLAGVRRLLLAHQPPGFAAALCRSVLLAVFGVIEVFALIDDEGSRDRCHALLDTVELLADRLSGAV